MFTVRGLLHNSLTPPCRELLHQTFSFRCRTILYQTRSVLPSHAFFTRNLLSFPTDIFSALRIIHSTPFSRSCHDVNLSLTLPVSPLERHPRYDHVRYLANPLTLDSQCAGTENNQIKIDLFLPTKIRYSIHKRSWPIF